MYEYNSRVRLTEVDQNQRMTLTGILNAFQDCSTFHSEDLGAGMDYLKRRERMWVLRFWQIQVFRYPRLAEHIRVGTWPYEFGRMTGGRNFRLMDEDGNMAACADSTWVFMDTRRMRPAYVDKEVIETYRQEPRLLMEKGGAIRIPEKLTEEEPFVIHSRHLDVNHHVNNGQYVQLAAEYLPEGFRIHQMQAEYKKPAMLNDRIYPKVGRCGDDYTILMEDKTGKMYAAVEFRSFGQETEEDPNPPNAEFR